MNLRNRVQLIGNVGADPVVKEFGNDKKLVRFSVATTDVYKKDEDIVKETQWHNIVVWNKLADLAAKNVIKGTEVVIDGKLVRRSYEDNRGNKQYITEVVAESLLFNNSKINQSVEVEAKRA